MADTDASDTKACPFCGETIKAVAIRCKHCQADLTVKPADADFDRGLHRVAPASGSTSASNTTAAEEDFERRFLEFAYETDEKLTAISVAHALKLPIAFCDARLESLAAGDTIRREVDDEGNVYFELPGGSRGGRGGHGGGMSSAPGVPQGASLVVQGSGSIVHVHDRGVRSLTPVTKAPTEAQAVVGLVLNLCIPGVGSLVAGKPGAGIGQFAMLVAGLPLCFIVVGFPIVFAAWLWALMTGVQALQEAKGLSAPAP
jgi:TM2 domain-containing membrane protein YozV